MKKISIILLLLVAISALFIVGCSDDDKITAAATAQGWIIGQAYTNPEIRFSADIFPMTNSTFTIDSIIAGDSLCINEDYDYWYIYGDGNYDYAYYRNSADSLRFSSGDMYDITFYRNNSSVSVSMKLLNRQDDKPNYILPIADDTIGLGDPLDIIWNSVPNADWYGLYIRYYKDSAGTYVSNHEYLSVTDTIYNIPTYTNIYDGYYRIYIVAVTGPGDGDAPNLDGNGLLGEFHSKTSSNFRRVYVGTGDPTPVGGIIEDENIDLNTIGKEIIRQVRKFPDAKPIEK